VRDHNNNVLRTEDGYAGHGQGVNNPDREAEQRVGPIPRGEYNIGPAENHPTTGPVSLRLTPSANTDTLGRSGFLIHGDNARGDRSASEGCIVVSRQSRELINQHGGGTLTVVRGPAQNQQNQPGNQGQPAAGNPNQQPPERPPQRRQGNPQNPNQRRRQPQGNPPMRERDQRHPQAPDLR
jgi:type VI secretion system (T6SS) effector TldE1-like protein